MYRLYNKRYVLRKKTKKGTSRHNRDFYFKTINRNLMCIRLKQNQKEKYVAASQLCSFIDFNES